jgi:hypothetical protein
MFRISERETTPVSLPLSLAPGIIPELMDVGPEAWKLGNPDPWEGDDETWGGEVMDDGGKVGVGGAEDAGLGVSTIHILHNLLESILTYKDSNSDL